MGLLYLFYRYVILIVSFTMVDDFCGSYWYVILMFHHCLVMILAVMHVTLLVSFTIVWSHFVAVLGLSY